MKRLADKPPHKVYEWFRQWIEDASSSDDD
jgi:hypothetical protein